jgi:hypothetical protein
MRYFIFLLAISLFVVLLSGCTMPYTLADRSGNFPVFTSSGMSSLTLHHNTLPVIVVLHQPPPSFQSTLTKLLRDSLSRYGIEPQFEIYGPLTLKSIESELPRIQQLDKPYLWIQTEDHMQALDPDRVFTHVNSQSVYNVRLFQKDQTVWRANSQSLVGDSEMAYFQDGGAAKILVHYLTRIMRKDGVLSTHYSAVQ